MKTQQQLVILGSGPAGLTAAIYAARAQLSPLVIDGPTPGGQLMGTSYVENWPGEQKILGPDLMLQMREHARHFGTQFTPGAATNVDLTKRPFVITTEQETVLTKALIIATGATPKRLGCKGEDLYWGKGVTTCAVCDGALYPDKHVVIVGGGDTAMEDASFMTKFTNKITVVQNLPTLTASKPMQQRVLNNPNITIMYNSLVTEIKGDGKQVTGVVVTNQKDHTTQTLPANVVFIAIGLRPNTGLFQGQLPMDSYGYLLVENHTKTAVAGVFAAGDVADWRYRQAITSAGAGCMAALDAERYLTQQA